MRIASELPNIVLKFLDWHLHERGLVLAPVPIRKLSNRVAHVNESLGASELDSVRRCIWRGSALRQWCIGRRHRESSRILFAQNMLTHLHSNHKLLKKTLTTDDLGAGPKKLRENAAIEAISSAIMYLLEG